MQQQTNSAFELRRSGSGTNTQVEWIVRDDACKLPRPLALRTIEWRLSTDCCTLKVREDGGFSVLLHKNAKRSERERVKDLLLECETGLLVCRGECRRVPEFGNELLTPWGFVFHRHESFTPPSPKVLAKIGEEFGCKIYLDPDTPPWEEYVTFYVPPDVRMSHDLIRAIAEKSKYGPLKEPWAHMIN